MRRHHDVLATNVETLESRQMMDASGSTFELENGELVLRGTDQNDAASVRYVAGKTEIEARVGRERQRFDVEQVSLIKFLGGSGNDVFRNRTDVDSEFHGGAGNDKLFGGSGNDRGYGGAGQDLVVGLRGDDFLDGEDGRDRIVGGPGGDIVLGGAGDDLLIGLAGGDTLHGGDGADKLVGGPGSDTIHFDDSDPSFVQQTDDAATQDDPAVVINQAMSNIVTAYNTSRQQVMNSLQSMVEASLGEDLPVVSETLGGAFDIAGKLGTIFDIEIDGAATELEIEGLFNSLGSAGFQLEYLSTTADTNGDLMRVTYDRTFTTDVVNLTLLGDTGIDYFDDDVNGQLSGSIQGSSPTIRIRFTFGVDTLNDVPTFYIADDSFVSIDDLSATGQVEGRLAIRYLAGVGVSGSLTAELNGSLNLVDSDSDHKLRVSDLGSASSVVGDLDGSISLSASFSTDLPVLKDISWQGEWLAEIENGVVDLGMPTFALPSANDVTAALLNSFVDMKEDFAFLQPISDILSKELPGIDSTLGELSGANSKLGWLNQGAGSVSAVKAELRQLGIEIMDIDTTTVGQLINGEKLDLVKFHTSASDTLLSEHGEFLIAAAPIGGALAVTLSGTIDAELGWQYEVGFGVDTTGVWIDPRTSLGLYGGVSAGIQAELSLAGLLGLSLEAGAGVQVFAGIGLSDPNPSDGRIYMDEIWAGADDSRDLGTAILDVIDVDMRIEAEGYVKAELDLPWPLPDVTLVDESFSLGAILDVSQAASQTENLRRIPLAGQGQLAPPVQLQSDGTLIITGTDESDYVGLKGGDGDVEVKFSGYRTASFSGVQKVEFHGHGDDDSLTVDRDFNIAIDAYGGAGNDVLFGGSANDRLDGGSGEDKLVGGAGADHLFGRAGHDLIDGGVGDDTIRGGAEGDLLRGNAGSDYIHGGTGTDAIEGGAGNDTLIGGEGFDAIYGGTGNDTLDGGADNDNLSGDEGNDTLSGGAGDDAMHGGIGADTMHGGTGKDLLFGGIGEDEIHGNDGDDIVLAGAGNDYVNGGRGSDFIRGEAGDDALYGSVTSDHVDDEQDIDTIFGGNGSDFIRGGRGTDYLNGDAGSDDINGEAGEDVIIVDLTTSAGAIGDLLAGGVDRDKLWISPAYQVNSDVEEQAKEVVGDVFDRVRTGTHTLDPASGIVSVDSDEVDLNAIAALTTDASTSGTGDNEIQVTQTGMDDFTVDQYDRVTGQLVATMSFTLTGGANTDLEIITIAGMDGDDLIQVSDNTTRNLYLDGGDGNDELIGGSGRDVIIGGEGDDVLYGGANNDELHGGVGEDTIHGEEGTDRLYGGADNDTMNGGAGFDVQFGGQGDDYMEAGAGPAGDIMYGDNDGSAGNDTIIGGDGRDAIFGGGGDDEIDGGSLDDVILGEDGNDVIRGGSGADFIFGGDGDDTLHSFTDDVAQLDQLADMDWNQHYARLDDHHDNMTDRLWLADEEIDAIDMLDGVTNDKVVSQITAGGVEAAQQKLADAKQQLADLWTDINAGLIAFNDVDREITLLETRITALDRLDGASADDLSDARIDPDLLENVGQLQSRLDALVPQAAEFESARNSARGLLDDIPAEYTVETSDLIDGGSGNDHLHGTVFGERLIGNSGDDTFYHSGGADIIVGGTDSDGDDTDTYLIRGTENDDNIRITAQQGTSSNLEFEVTINGDTSVFEPEVDVERLGVLGLGGNDEMRANFGQNALTDVYFDGGEGDDIINVGEGDDGEQPIESSATLIGGDGNDTLTGGLSDDLLDGGAGNDTLFGGDGRDTLRGGEGIDVLHGEAGADMLDGGAHNDKLYGGTENDTLNGGAGADLLKGDEHDDTFLTRADEAEFDEMFGGSGYDTLQNISSEALVLNSFTATNELEKIDGNGRNVHGNNSINRFDFRGVVLTGVHAVRAEGGNDTVFTSDETAGVIYYGGDGDDLFYGQGFRDYIYGDNGADVIRGGGGNDDLYGGNGNDSLYGGANNDTIRGGNGDDYIQGNDGNDALYGDRDNDWIVGGDGGDLIDGGHGSDFTYFHIVDRVRGVETFNNSNVQVAHADGRTFILHSNRGVYSTNGSYSWRLETAHDIRTLVAARGTVYVLADGTNWGNRGVWQWANGTFNGNVITGLDVNTLVANHNTIYVLPDNGAVWKLTDSGFVQISGNDVLQLWTDGNLIRVRTPTHFDAYNGSSWGH